MNATAFDGKWTKHYTRNDIDYKEFHNSDGTIKETAMLDISEREYVENDSFTGFVKPYKDIGFSFMALPDLIQRLTRFFKVFVSYRIEPGKELRILVMQKEPVLLTHAFINADDLLRHLHCLFRIQHVRASPGHLPCPGAEFPADGSHI